jgi:hypothetical protein
VFFFSRFCASGKNQKGLTCCDVVGCFNEESEEGRKVWMHSCSLMGFVSK